MNLTNLYVYMMMYFFITKTQKKKNYLYSFSMIQLLFVFLINQYNTTFNNISNYYQIISYLNSKNNIIIIVVCLFLSLFMYFKKNYITIVLLFVFYEYNHLNNYINPLFILWKNYENSLNTNLINGIMLIHPVLLYLYYVLVFYYILIINNDLNFKITKGDKLFYRFNFLYSVCYLILLSILLGCWWAEQELSWGGWWSWDFVELIALNYFILKLFYIHKKKDRSSIFNFKQVIYFLSTLVIFIIFVRFNLINSIHNFINSDNSNQYYIYILMFMLFLFIFILKVNFNKSKSTSKLIYSYSFLIALFFLTFITIILFNVYLKNTINVKSIYMIIIFFILLLFMKKNNFVNYIYLTQIYVIAAILSISNTTDLFILTSIFVIFIYLRIIYTGVFKKKFFHLILLLLFLISLNQIYTFSKEIYCFKNNNIISLYKNTQIYIDYIFFKPDINYTCVNFFKPNIFILKDIYQNNTLTVDELNKSIFEKKLYFEKNFLFELYNYNFQFFLNINIFILLLLFLLLLFLLLLFLLLKKTNIKI